MINRKALKNFFCGFLGLYEEILYGQITDTDHRYLTREGECFILEKVLKKGFSFKKELIHTNIRFC